MAEKRGRRTSTVRFRVTALATVAVTVVLLVTGVALVRYQRAVLTESLDEALQLEGDDLAASLPPPSPTLGPVIDDDGLAQVVQDGAVVASTSNVAGQPPLVAGPASGTDIRTVGVLVADESPYRVLARAEQAEGNRFLLIVGAPTDDVDDATASLARALAIAMPAVLALLAVLVWVLVKRTLAPVEAIRAEVAAIGAGELDRRVPQPPTDDEVGRLAVTMNEMLDRLDDAARRQQQFVADASHELRSPLARMRSEVEVDLARPERAEPFDTLRSVLDEVDELAALVDDLMALARADAGATTVHPVPVDLDDIVLGLVRRAGSDNGVTVDATGVSAAQVAGEERQLSHAVGNLIDNAVRHATTTVRVSLMEHGSEAVLSVTDDGPGIPADQHQRVFERFARLDDARARDTGGSGLGLAIARDIVTRHGGTVLVDPDHADGARFIVRLPLVG